MHLRNRSLGVLLCLALLPAAGFSQSAQPASPAGQKTQLPVDRDPVFSPDDVAPGVPAAAVVTTTPQPGNTANIPDTGKTGEVESHGGQYTFRKNVEEVILHATVVDQKQHLVTGLPRSAFTVFEDGVQQQLTSFRQEDVPVAIGILIDNSGSMRDKRPSVNQAALDLVRYSNKDDEVFVVNFSDEAFIDQDFTSSVPKLREALDHIDSRGGTALYDAVMASADYVSKKAKLEKQILVVVTDGEDNASLHSLEEAVHSVQNGNGVTVYAIGILGTEKQRRARRALETLATQTGGVAYFPKDAREVDSIATEVAHDIRNQYIIEYKSSKPQDIGGYRTVKVLAKAPGHPQLFVRTRSGYYPGEGKGTKTQQQRAAK